MERGGEWDLAGCACVHRTLARELRDGFGALSSPCAGVEFRRMITAALLAGWGQTCEAEEEGVGGRGFGAPPGPRRGPLLAPMSRSAQFVEI